ncbi:MAG: hypothetical protein WKF73_03025 [Nocardioidaceae bacterium]
MGWHDAAVRLRGPAVADGGRPLRAALERGRQERRCQSPGAPDPRQGDVEVQVRAHSARSAPMSFAPRGTSPCSRRTSARCACGAVHLPGEPVPVVTGGAWTSSRTELRPIRRCDDFRVWLLLAALASRSDGRDTTRGQLGRPARR